MSKIIPQSLSDKTYQLIKKDIVSCILNPGQLIIQNELVEKYQVGLTPVREALRQLAQEGFIQSIPRLGFVVSQITPRDIDEIFEVRLVLETSSSVLAATRGDPLELKKILDNADFTYLYHDHQSYTEFLKRNAEFHIAIAASTCNQRLVFLVSKTMDELNRVFHLGLDLKDSAEEMRQDHLALANALYQRNSVLAEKITHDEILRSRARVMSALEKINFGTPPPFIISSRTRNFLSN